MSAPATASRRMSRDQRGLAMASASSQGRPAHRPVAGHSFFRDLLARSSLARQRAAQQQPQAQRELPKLNAALCLHGTRTWLLPRTADKLLRELATQLVEIHGQHEHQRLFDPAEQLQLLDTFAGLGDALAGYRERRASSRAPRAHGGQRARHRLGIFSRR